MKLAADEGEVAETREIDLVRYADYDEHGGLIGVEFLGVSRGINLDGVPERHRVAEALRSLRPLASV